ncbi:MAG: Ig-like domain-containing protein [Bacteroidales bacterium]|nr:Ig-like domain-containing protein [Candidatus Physcousia equi]
MNHRLPHIVFLLTALLFAACASIGSPDGGRYDEEPPVVVNSMPLNRAVMSNRKKITIYFDEYIKLENPSEKVIVSPPQVEMPNIRAVDKRVRIDLYDSLQANTTYTIDFSDAITDNNEGNPMGLYTFTFATGETIDTMEVSGSVLNARDLEPIKGILVGLHRADSTFTDSTFRTRPFLRVGRTNGSGRFTIKGVAPGRYRAFALKDMDGNYAYTQKSEQLAFDTTAFEVSKRPDLRPDTVWTDSIHYEKIRMVPYIHYYPDDLCLMAFLEDGQERHLLKSERLTPEKFTLYFTAPHDSLPIIEGLGFDSSKLFCEANPGRDTLTYWIPDTTIAHNDTLRFNLTYFDTDSLGTLVLRTDSLHELVPKQPHAKLERERQKKSEEWKKDREKREKKTKEPLPYEANPYEEFYAEASIKPGGTLEPNQNLSFLFSEPLARIDTTRISFRQRVDSNFVDRPFLFLPDDDNNHRYTLYAEWEPSATYELRADSLTFQTIFGHPVQSIKQSIRVRSLDEFGTLFLRFSNLDLQPSDTAYVELLNKSDTPIRKQAIVQSRADFFYLKPDAYYMRLFIDRNGNGTWDTGNYDEQRQPEEVFYFPKPLHVRAKWEVEQAWDVRGIDRIRQKPETITKQKPDKERTIKNRNAERENQGKKK